MEYVWILEDKKTNAIEGVYKTQELAYKYAKYIENKTGRKFALYRRPIWES